MRLKTKNVIFSIIICLLLLVFVAGGIKLMANYLDNNNIDIDSILDNNSIDDELYVEYCGKKITSDVSSVVVTAEDVFAVKCNGNMSKYTVKIFVNDSINFVYRVDGEAFNFNDLGDVTSSFEIIQNENGFVIDSFTIQDILNNCHPGSNVVYDKPSLDYNQDFFVLVISVKDKDPINIYFHNEISVDGISISEDVVEV